MKTDYLDTNFGCDPEVFIVGKGGVIPPAAFIADYGIPFHKLDAPKKIIIEGNGYKVIEDGAATELNVDPDSYFPNLWVRINSALSNLNNWLHKTPMSAEGAILTIMPSVAFDKQKYWINRDESFRDCVRFGCDPDLDIYTGKYSKEISVEDIKLRFGGGHLHMQAPSDYPELFQENYYHTTRLMDILVGNAATAIMRNSPSMDEAEKERLKYYGQPGKIRLQVYGDKIFGIEYRTPSNFWLNDMSYAHILFLLMNCCLNLTRHPLDANDILELPKAEHAPSNIINYDKKRATELIMSSIDRLVSMKYLNFDDLYCIMKVIDYKRNGRRRET
jgi:hypothetical protein